MDKKRCGGCLQDMNRALGTIYLKGEFKCYTCQIIKMPDRCEKLWYRQVYGFLKPTR